MKPKQRIRYMLRAINNNYLYVIQKHKLDSQSIRVAYQKVLHEQCRLLKCIKVYDELVTLLHAKSLEHYQYYLNSMCQATGIISQDSLDHLCLLMSELVIESLYLKWFEDE